MGSLTPIAKSAGASIDEMLAGMASLTKNGLKTDEAVTALKGVFSSVIKPTEEAAKTAQQLGIDFSVSALKSKGFAKFLEEIKVKTGGNTETMGKLFGNVRALSGALVLTGKGFGDFNTSLDAMKNSAGLT
ncbi:phage tail tape measure protein, partial [Clostridium sporogenes]